MFTKLLILFNAWRLRLMYARVEKLRREMFND